MKKLFFVSIIFFLLFIFANCRSFTLKTLLPGSWELNSNILEEENEFLEQENKKYFLVFQAFGDIVKGVIFSKENIKTESEAITSGETESETETDNDSQIQHEELKNNRSNYTKMGYLKIVFKEEQSGYVQFSKEETGEFELLFNFNFEATDSGILFSRSLYKPSINKNDKKYTNIMIVITSGHSFMINFLGNDESTKILYGSHPIKQGPKFKKYLPYLLILMAILPRALSALKKKKNQPDNEGKKNN
ncbi:hypothetical protein M0812_27056 [Anaeramoeba flamelloides]|uniref:Lipoprotein n=1 Tax=Anaeramoeba flamelloides TaxID=1746091 RepID=A0AAV7YG24_9EUKA|nr:hypothetical protein M0812_27056 [Anaeramoeba flamelloides]